MTTLPAFAADEKMKKTFTILHTNDMHSNFIGMAPSSDYTPLTINDDTTTGGYARIAAVIATRKKAREIQGPVLILDAGDFSMGTPFAAASREIGGELQLMARMGDSPETGCPDCRGRGCTNALPRSSPDRTTRVADVALTAAPW